MSEIVWPEVASSQREREGGREGERETEYLYTLGYIDGVYTVIEHILYIENTFYT